MKIARIETFLVPPRWLFVRVEADDGAFGWGEASLEGHAEAVDGAFEAFRDRFIGADPRRIEDIWQVAYRGGFYRGGPVLMSALAGLDQALWDLKGRHYGLPAWEMLGGKVRDKVRAYAWIGGDRPDDIAAAARTRREQGFSAVKMNATAEIDYLVAPKLDEVVDRVRAAQAEGMDVGVDFHGRVHRPMAKQLAKLLEPLGLLFIEEPILSENPEALLQLANLVTHADRGRRAALLALGLQAVPGERCGRHHPARPQPCRRPHRMPQDRGDGRKLRCRGGAALPARPDRARRLPAARGLHAQRDHPGNVARHSL